MAARAPLPRSIPPHVYRTHRRRAPHQDVSACCCKSNGGQRRGCLPALRRNGRRCQRFELPAAVGLQLSSLLARVGVECYQGHLLHGTEQQSAGGGEAGAWGHEAGACKHSPGQVVKRDSCCKACRRVACVQGPATQRDQRSDSGLGRLRLAARAGCDGWRWPPCWARRLGAAAGAARRTAVCEHRARPPQLAVFPVFPFQTFITSVAFRCSLSKTCRRPVPTRAAKPLLSTVPAPRSLLHRPVTPHPHRQLPPALLTRCRSQPQPRRSPAPAAARRAAAPARPRRRRQAPPPTQQLGQRQMAAAAETASVPGRVLAEADAFRSIDQGRGLLGALSHTAAL